MTYEISNSYLKTRITFRKPDNQALAFKGQVSKGNFTRLSPIKLLCLGFSFTQSINLCNCENLGVLILPLTKLSKSIIPDLFLITKFIANSLLSFA